MSTLVGWVLAVVVQLLLAPLVVALVLIGGSVYALVRYLRDAWELLTADRRDHEPAVAGPGGDEPAFRSYLLVQVWRDAWTVLRRTATRLWADVDAAARWVLKWLRGTEYGETIAGAAWPSGIAVAVGAVLTAVPLAVGLLALAAVLLGLVGLWVTGWLVGVCLLGGVERVLLLVRRVVLACPHPGCYRRIGLPVYACAAEDCRERHARLVPNRYGALHHVCRCGARLPTLILLGRHRLAAYCPHCRLRLPGRAGRVRVEHVPIIGGPDAGKTTFLCLSVTALRTWLAGGDRGVDFVDARDERRLTAAAAQLGRGEPLDKTAVELPRAVMLDVRGASGGGRILYLFDPAGEYYTTTSLVDSQRYLDHAEVALVVVDPLAVAAVDRGLSAAERRAVAAAAPANRAGVQPTQPGDAVDRLGAALRGRPAGGRLRRILVVVTKSDVLRDTEVGAALGQPAADVRAWLVGVGWGNWARALDQYADQVRYLASGLDLGPAELAEPVAWLAGVTPDAGSTVRLRAVARPRARQAPERWAAPSGLGLVPAAYRFGRLSLLSVGAVAAVVAVLVTSGTVALAVLSLYPL